MDKQQLEAIKAFLKALKIKFELAPDKPYNKKFVAMIKQGDKDLKNGKGKRVKAKNLGNLWK